jgi:acetolactate synthase-1/3 small subunit
MEGKTLYTVTIFSENTVGVLNQITTVFSESEEAMKKLVRQIDKRIDVLKAYFNVDDELIHQELALYKLATDKILEHGSIEYLIRKYNIRVLEVNNDCVVFLKAGHYAETQGLFDELAEKIGVLQFIRSGRIAITKSKVERLSDMLAQREEMKQEQLSNL